MNSNRASLLKFWTFVLDIQATAKVYEAVTLNLSLPKTKSFILQKNTKKNILPNVTPSIQQILTLLLCNKYESKKYIWPYKYITYLYIFNLSESDMQLGI